MTAWEFWAWYLGIGGFTALPAVPLLYRQYAKQPELFSTKAENGSVVKRTEVERLRACVMIAVFWGVVLSLFFWPLLVVFGVAKGVGALILHVVGGRQYRTALSQEAMEKADEVLRKQEDALRQSWTEQAGMEKLE